MSGIFGLSAYNDRNLAGLIPDKTRESFREFGYFGGGGPTTTSVVDRIDYSNDTATASVRGPLSLAKFSLAATGNSNFGYFGGGVTNPGPVSIVDRIDYSNDSATASVRGPLSLVINGSAATGNSNFGYFGGGVTTLGRVSIVDRIDYSNDSATVAVRGPLSLSRDRLAATGNSNFGYFGGGYSTSNVSIIDRIDYKNDSVISILRSNLSLNNRALAATGNSNFGYYGGGAVPALLSKVDRIDYSNDTQNALSRGNLNSGTNNLTASGNSNFGYFGGGKFGVNSTTVERIDYSNDTVVASIRGPLSNTSRSLLASTSSHNFGGSPISQYGVFPKPFVYFGVGGLTRRFDFSNDTSASVSRTSIFVGSFKQKATGNSNYAWIGGGVFPVSSRVYRFDYSNDNAGGVQRGPLSAARGYFAATGNYNFGYFSGGADVPGPNTFSIVDRIDYSNDNVTALRRGSLSVVNSEHTGVSNLSYGYFIGGSPAPATKSWVERINYSNDNASTSYRSPLQNSRRLLASSGNLNFAYVSGGDVGGTVNSIVERIDYASDTSATSVRGPLSLARRELAGTGNSNFGYFGGGDTPSASRSTVDRIDYSNDTATATSRTTISVSKTDYGISPLTPSSAFSPDQLIRGTSDTDFQPTSTFFDIQSMRRIQDTTNASVKKRVLGSYGYFYQAYSTTNTNLPIWRVDISNDLVAPPVRSSTSSDATQVFGGFGNNNYGYIAGGGGFNVPLQSYTQRLEYSNDTSTMTVRGNLNENKGLETAGLNSSSFGYICGGQNPGGIASSISRMDFSNDTTQGLRKGQLTIARSVIDGISTKSYGYLGSGGPGIFQGSNTRVDRVDFSNDSVNANIKGPLNYERGRYASAGNYVYGYFAGGRIPGSPGSGIIVSHIERITYANDLVVASNRGNLNTTKNIFSAFSNNYYVWCSGGEGSTGSTQIERIDISNDTALASIRGGSTGNNSSVATTNARNS
jgi:hypothetical protein